MRLKEALQEVYGALKEGGIEGCRLDSELIVMEAAGCTRLQLITKDGMLLTDRQLKNIRSFTKRRLKREPMQYILGRCEFMGLSFEVNPRVLIPRGDTECLVELVLEHIKNTSAQTVLDIGTGSGAIIVSLAALSHIKGTAVDISSEALEAARKNAAANGVLGKIDFVQSDLFQRVEGSFDIIVSNPPYIEREVIKTLESNVKDYEPILALDGGEDGLDFYRRIISSAPKHLSSKGLIALEIGCNQGEAVKKLLERGGFTHIKVGKDLSGLDRTVLGRLK